MNDKLNIRPRIDSIDENLNTLSVEAFQNKTLRPILKLQSDLILAHFNAYLKFNKIDLNLLNKAKLNDLINNLINSNQVLKIELKMMVIAMFTMEEYQFYSNNPKVHNKRITAMLIQRIKSQIIS